MKINSSFKLILLTTILLNACSVFDRNAVSEIAFEPIVDIGSSAIPYIQIKTELSILNEPKVVGEMLIFEKQELVHKVDIGIEYRGSTSFRLSDKKSFGLETRDRRGNDKDYPLMGMPAEEDWILMGHVFKASENRVFDPSMMHHYLGYEWSRKMGRYASRTRWVELEINGRYVGLYLLMEKLKIDEQRIDIEPLGSTVNLDGTFDGGYILKIDKTSGGIAYPNVGPSYYENNWEDDARYNSTNSFRSKYDIYGEFINFAPYGPPYHQDQYLETYFLYDEPESDELSLDQKSHIQTEIQLFERSLLTLDKDKLNRIMDFDSFVDFFLLNELCGNIDAYRLSTFLYKNRDAKIAMGPIWDLNIGYNRQNRVPYNDWIANYNQYVSRDPWMVPFWWSVLLNEPFFMSAVADRWNTLRTTELTDLYLTESIVQTAYYLTSNGAVQRNYERWNGLSVDYAQTIDELKDWVVNRAHWMDSKLHSSLGSITN